MLVIVSINIYTDVLPVSMSELNMNPEGMKICITEVWLLLTDGSVSDGKSVQFVHNISLNSITF